MNMITQEAKKRQVVRLASRKGKSFASRIYGVSLSSAKRWSKRYDGEVAIADSAVTPSSQPSKTAQCR